MKSNNKILNDVYKILNEIVYIDIHTKIKEIKNTYLNELKGFKYVDEKQLLNLKKKYIRYVGFDNKINYGGFLIKSENKNNYSILYIMNQHKQVWTIKSNQYYIFVKDILNNNEKMRKEFEQYLIELNKK